MITSDSDESCHSESNSKINRFSGACADKILDDLTDPSKPAGGGSRTLPGLVPRRLGVDEARPGDEHGLDAAKEDYGRN